MYIAHPSTRTMRPVNFASAMLTLTVLLSLVLRAFANLMENIFYSLSDYDIYLLAL